MPDPVPGQFYNGIDLPPADDRKVVDRKVGNNEISLETSEYEVANLNAFNNEFKPKSDLVYYPCCGQDISPSQVFHQRVVYLDGNPRCVEALKQAGYEAHEADANEFNPGNVDIAVVYNPQISPEPFLKYVNEGGYVVCNNYHSTANFMNQRDDFEFMGAVDANSSIDRTDLTDYWQEVKSDEELFLADPNAAKRIQDIVLKLTGQSDNILPAYRQILTDSPNGMVMHEGQMVVLWDIPTKKQSGTYIFCRKEK